MFRLPPSALSDGSGDVAMPDGSAAEPIEQEPAGSVASVLAQAAAASVNYLRSVADRPVSAGCDSASAQQLYRMLDGGLPDEGTEPARVVHDLSRCAERGVVASAGPRYFGYVVGGSHPVGLAADWLVSTYDQFGSTFDASPAMSVAEQIALDWVVELLGLRGGSDAPREINGGSGVPRDISGGSGVPRDISGGSGVPREISGGFTTGSTMAHVTALAAARHALLAARGWDVEANGLSGGPDLRVVVGADVHVSVLAALQYLGIGRERALRVPTDDHGRMIPDELALVLAQHEHPVVVCAQAGEINTGCFDPITEIAAITRARGDWLHIDGAFGLWAAAAPTLAHLTAGIELADSWATDGHKMLNVPYDCGIVLTAHPEAHRAAMTTHAPYTTVGPNAAARAQRNGMDWVPEMARRARGVPVYAVLRTLGRSGVADLITRCHRHAVRMANQVGADPFLRVPHPVVFNQVLIDPVPPGLDPASAELFVQLVIDEIRAEGTCWIGGTRWRGLPMLRVSVANWSTTTADIDRSAAAIRAAVHHVTEFYRTP